MNQDPIREAYLKGFYEGFQKADELYADRLKKTPVGVISTPKVKRGHRTRTKWTPEEISQLIELYPTRNTRELAKHLGKSYEALQSRAVMLKLHKQKGDDYAGLARLNQKLND